MPLSGGNRLGRLVIKRSGNASRAPLVGHGVHDDRPPHFSDPQLDRVTGPDLLRGLRAGTVDPHAAADDRIGCCGSGFEEPSGVEPFVNPGHLSIRLSGYPPKLFAVSDGVFGQPAGRMT